MVLVITVIGTLIHIYAAGYMARRARRYWRFFAYLNLFVFAMLLLVLGDGFVTLFFGWEGVGLCSYLLIGFWYAEPKNARAGMKAFVVNRIGDWGFFAGVALLFWALGRLVVRPIDHRYYLDADARPRRRCRRCRSARSRRLSPRPRSPLAFAAKTVFGAPLPLVVGALPLARRLRQVGASAAARVAARRHGRPDAGLGAHPRRDHGDRRRLPGRAPALPLRALAGGDDVIVCRRPRHRARRRHPRHVPVRHQAGARLLDGVAARLHVRRRSASARWAAALFHLVTHACFKACLFLGVGLGHPRHASADARAPHRPPRRGDAESEPETETDRHALASGDDEHQPAQLDPRVESDPIDPQDMRNMGGLGALMPTTRLDLPRRLLGHRRLSLGGGLLVQGRDPRRCLRAAAVFCGSSACDVAGLTAFYMFRSYYLTFEARPATAAHKRTCSESPRVMTSVLWMLAAASIVVGPARAPGRCGVSAARTPSTAACMLALMAGVGRGGHARLGAGARLLQGRERAGHAARGQPAALREPARVRLRHLSHRRTLRGDLRARLPARWRARRPGSTTHVVDGVVARWRR